METRPLGNTGHDVTAVGFGAWALGGLGYGDQVEADAFEAIDTYLEAGGRFFDTARGYGVSEIRLGNRLAAFEEADEVFVCSKSASKHPPTWWADLETTLFCLQREPVDLYYVHVPSGDREKMDRLLDAYVEQKDAGKIGHVAVSCGRVGPGEQGFDSAMPWAEDPRVEVIQINYSYAEPWAKPIMEAARANGTGVVARSNILGGLLTGKYRPGHRFDNPANEGRAGIDPGKLDRILAIVQDIEENLLRPPYENMIELALAYALAHPAVSAIIPGARSREQVLTNIAVDARPPMDPSLAAQIEEAGEEIGRIRHG